MTPKTIQRMRKRFGWTQAELADRLGGDHQTIWNWEHGGKIPPPSLVALRMTFEVAAMDRKGVKR